MKYYELDKEEQEISDAFDRGELKSVPHVKKEIARYVSYARADARRNKNINIRISEHTLHKLKVKAAQKGLPYQTLISSLLHQYTNR